MTPAERARRYWQAHRARINRTRRLRRRGLAQPATRRLAVRLTQLDGPQKLAAFHRQRARVAQQATATSHAGAEIAAD